MFFWFEDFWYYYGQFITGWLVGAIISGVLFYVIITREFEKDSYVTGEPQQSVKSHIGRLILMALFWPFVWVVSFVVAMKQ